MTVRPRGPHAVARIVPKDPSGALESTIHYLPVKSADPPPRDDRREHRWPALDAARARREQSETD